ncbi:MAG: hypothetical protein AAFU38_16535, partial [Bacteroidota bacterium]
MPAPALLSVLFALLAAGGCVAPQPAADTAGTATEAVSSEPPASLTIAAIERAVFAAANEARQRQGLAMLDPDAARSMAAMVSDAG